MTTTKHTPAYARLPGKLHTYDEQLRQSDDPGDPWIGECNKTAWGSQCAKEIAHRYNCHMELLEQLQAALILVESQFGEAPTMRAAIAKAEGK